jgi:hypothetical protein
VFLWGGDVVRTASTFRSAEARPYGTSGAYCSFGGPRDRRISQRNHLAPRRRRRNTDGAIGGAEDAPGPLHDALARGTGDFGCCDRDPGYRG